MKILKQTEVQDSLMCQPAHKKDVLVDGWIFFEEGKNVRPILVGLFVHIRP